MSASLFTYEWLLHINVALYCTTVTWTFGAYPYIYISKVKKIGVLFLILLIYLCSSKGGRYPNRGIIQDVFFVGI